MTYFQLSVLPLYLVNVQRRNDALPAQRYYCRRTGPRCPL